MEKCTSSRESLRSTKEIIEERGASVQIQPNLQVEVPEAVVDNSNSWGVRLENSCSFLAAFYERVKCVLGRRVQDQCRSGFFDLSPTRIMHVERHPYII